MSSPDEARPDQGDQPPADVSNQNREEPSAPHSGAGAEQAEGDQADTSHPPDSQRSSQRDDGTPGGSGESSQASGHPGNAG